LKTYTKSAPIKSIMSYNLFIAEIAETASPNCPIPNFAASILDQTICYGAISYCIFKSGLQSNSSSLPR